jgi:hypothetical protein
MSGIDLANKADIKAKLPRARSVLTEKERELRDAERDLYHFEQLLLHLAAMVQPFEEGER